MLLKSSLKPIEKTSITSENWITSFPDIFDEIIVWADYRDCVDPNSTADLGCVEIWGYDLKKQTEFQITNSPGRRKADPRIWGNRVYFQMDHEKGDGFGLYVVELKP